MTRDEARQFLINSGVAEPSDEAISGLLNTIQKSVKSAEDKAAHFKAESERVHELEKELKALNDANLSESEKSAKAVEEAKKEVEILKQTVQKMTMEKNLAEIGIVGDDATGLFENGELNTVKLGEILTAREKNAVAAYQKEALNATPSPQGGGKEEPDEKPDIKYAKEYVAKTKANNSQSIIDSYIGGN